MLQQVRAPPQSSSRTEIMLPLAYLLTSIASASPSPCAGGQLIDLGASPSITMDGQSQGAWLTFEGQSKPSEALIEEFGLPGLASSGWIFTPLDYLEWKGIPPSVLRSGGALRIDHGVNIGTELERTDSCVVTLDPAPASIRIAEEQLQLAKKKAAMLSVMVCDPEQTLDHKIKVAPGAAQISVPVGQANQGEGVLTILVETSEYSSIGHQDVIVKGGKFVSASASNPALFCPATSFDTMCVNTEEAFKITGNKPFRVSTEVDWFEMSLTGCTVSR